MKKLNLIFLSLGILICALVFTLNINGTLGWLLTSAGVIFIGIGIFISNNPIRRFIIEAFLNFF